MGWDADALKDDEYLNEDAHAGILAAFRAAAQRLQEQGIGYDIFLPSGGLDCSDCRRFLEQALRVPAEGIWSPEEVRDRAETAVWPEPHLIPPEALWAYWSAKKFIELCVAYELGIAFDR